MLPFLHHRAAQLDGLLASANAALVRYNALALDLDAALVAHLEQSVTTYRDLGLSVAENEMLCLRAQYASARQGVHPLTLEHRTTHRRALERAIAQHVLGAGSELIRGDLTRIRAQLDEGTGQLRAIVLGALARGLILPADLPLPDQAAVDAFWEKVKADPDLALAARQVTLNLHALDIRLLLLDLVGPAD